MKTLTWSYFRSLALWRWLLPLGMVIFTLAVELLWHAPHNPQAMENVIWFSIAIYGFVGPVVIAVLMWGLHRHQRALAAAEEELRRSHADLEQLVDPPANLSKVEREWRRTIADLSKAVLQSTRTEIIKVRNTLVECRQWLDKWVLSRL